MPNRTLADFDDDPRWAIRDNISSKQKEIRDIKDGIQEIRDEIKEAEKEKDKDTVEELRKEIRLERTRLKAEQMNLKALQDELRVTEPPEIVEEESNDRNLKHYKEISNMANKRVRRLDLLADYFDDYKEETAITETGVEFLLDPEGWIEKRWPKYDEPPHNKFKDRVKRVPAKVRDMATEIVVVGLYQIINRGIDYYDLGAIMAKEKGLKFHQVVKQIAIDRGEEDLADMQTNHAVHDAVYESGLSSGRGKIIKALLLGIDRQLRAEGVLKNPDIDKKKLKEIREYMIYAKVDEMFQTNGESLKGTKASSVFKGLVTKTAKYMQDYIRVNRV